MNILLINHYAGTPELGMEFRPYYLAKEWVKAGHHVSIIAANYSHLRKNQPRVKEENIDGIRYFWLKTNKYNNNGWKRILSMFIFCLQVFIKHNRITKLFKPDFVISSSTYPMDIFPAKKIAKKYNAKLVFEIHDLWPLSPMILGEYSPNHPFIATMQFAENYAYKHCDKCISILPHVHEHVFAHGLHPEKLCIVPNGFTRYEWTNPVPLKTDYDILIKKIKLKESKIVGYLGGHAISNALDLLIDAMKLLEDKNIVCILVGNGVEKERLKKTVKEKNIKNVFFLDSVPKAMVPSLLAQMDILYLGGKNHPLYKYGTSQTKLFDYFQAAKPIIQTISPPNDYVRESQSGITIEQDTPKAVAHAISQLVSYPDNELKQMGLRGKKFCDENFEYSKLALDFIKYIN